MRHPNIVLIHADQHRFDCVGANGNPHVRTPNLDRIAREGATFTSAFTSSPICVPERNSLLFGRWSCNHLAIANRDTEAPRAAAPGMQAFTRLLVDAGYYLGFVGKWGIGPEYSPADVGFEDCIPDSAYAAARASWNVPPAPHKNRWFGETDPFIGPEQSRLFWGADRTVALLRKGATGDRPFFVRWDTNEPHLPNVVPEPYASLYDDEEIPPWPGFGDELVGKPYIQKQQIRTWGLEGWTWEDWLPTVRKYLGDVSLLDAAVGRVLEALDELGVADNTLLIYTTDHGDLCGGHGMIDKHYVMYDDVVHVPLLVRFPGVLEPGTVCSEFVVHSIDLAATFADIAGGGIPESFKGRSLMPVFEGRGGTGRTDAFAMYHGNQFGLYTQRMVRERRWKYVWNATAEDELYDLQADPGEKTNRATDAECAAELARLRRVLVERMGEAGDPLLNGWIREQLLENRKV